jgi:hypothetical protein
VFAWACRVHGFERCAGTLVKDALGLEALVLIVTVGSHAGSEGLEVEGAELVEDVLTGGALIFSGEAAKVSKGR